MAVSYLQSTSSTSDLSTYTFSSQNLGTEAADRLIAVSIHSRAAGSTALTISSVTIGGVAATVYPAINVATNATVAAIAVAAVPSGTTGDVVITFSRSQVRCAIGAWSLTGHEATAFDSQSVSVFALDPSTSSGFDTPANGAVLVAGSTSGSTTATLTGVTENYDSSVESGLSFVGGSASGVSATTNYAVTVDFATPNGETSAIFVSFSEAAVTGGDIEDLDSNPLGAITDFPVTNSSTVGGYTASAALTSAASTLSASGTFEASAFTAAASLTSSASTLSASATFEAPTYTGSASLTSAASTLAASGIFATEVYSASANLQTAATTITAVALFTAPEYTATVSLTTAATTLSASGNDGGAVAVVPDRGDVWTFADRVATWRVR